jgi:colanic acid/amylovoran biosynthesis protein
VAPETLTSDEQRGLVAASDFVLAGRYHPLVFAVSAGVPALVIPYEHKARGFAESAGLANYVIELGDLGSGALLDRLDDLLAHLGEAREHVQIRGPELRLMAESTSDRVAELVNHPNART